MKPRSNGLTVLLLSSTQSLQSSSCLSDSSVFSIFSYRVAVVLGLPGEEVLVRRQTGEHAGTLSCVADIIVESV